MPSKPTPAPSEWVFDEQAFLQQIPYPVTPTNVKGAYAGARLPDDFDPNTASATELIKNGILWRRPAANDPPALRQLWQKVCSRKWQMVVPVLEPQVGRTHNLRKAPRKVSDTNYLNGAWSGGGTFSGGPYTGIIGTWTVPTVSKAPQPPSGPGSYDSSHGISYDSSSWVGIDGFFVSNDVLQAGIEQYVDTSGKAHYVAWYEWFVAGDTTPPYVYQTNITTSSSGQPFSVSPGDEIYVSVQYVGKTSGSIYIANNTTGLYFSITLAPPSGASFNGSSVEWIMEDPDGGEDTNTALAKFTPVAFTSCAACNSSGAIANEPPSDNTINIETTGGTVLTNVVLGTETVTIDFI
jgi:hypothetical protein